MKATGIARFFSSSWSTVGVTALALTSAASLLTACGDGDVRPNRLDVAATPSSSEGDDEWLRQQQRLTVKRMSAGGTYEEEQTVAQAMQAVVGGCAVVQTGGQCGQIVTQNVTVPLCAARTALALSTPQSDPITVVQGVPPTTYVFDKITESNAAEFAAFAVDMARVALDGALSQLEHPVATCSPSPGVWTTPSMAPGIAAGAVDAYYMGRAAYERAVEATLAAADAARSSSSSPTDAARRSLLLQKFSRAAAAHMLVGGDDGLLGSTTRGYCAGSRLSPNAQSALQLLRDAAPSPAVIADSTKGIQDLLSLTSVAGGPVRKRLAAFHQIKELGWDPVMKTATAAPTQTIESYYDLNEGDFVEARQYLQQELAVFNRSPNALLPALNGVQPYAGVAGTSVPEIPAGAWSARGRYTASVQTWYNTAGFWPMAPNGSQPYNVAGYRTPPLDLFIAEAHSRIKTLIRTTTDSFSGPTPVVTDQQEVLGVLGSIVMSAEYRGAVEIQVPTNRTSISFVAHGFAPTDKVRVVVGEDGLRCAVQGSIEGAPCSDSLTGSLYGAGNATCNATPATLSCLTIDVPATVNVAGAPVYFGTTTYVWDKRTLSVATVDGLLNSKTRLYFVRPKDPAVEAPGTYELLVGSTISATPASGSYWYSAFPIVPTVDARAAEVLAPNRKNCVEQAVDCLGVRADARLPLEDELTDDGNGFENSWRHYLNLARQAADETALLGREFRDAKLNQLQGVALAAQRKEDQRQAAGNALQEVQNLCGTALDTNKLLDFLSRDPAGPVAQAVGAKKALSAVVSTTAGVRAIWDPTKVTPADVKGSALDPVELKRLQDCIDDGPATIEPFVTLGHREFCVQSVGSNICPANADCYGNPPCAVATKTAKPLGYFTTPTGSTPISTVNACEQLRIARGKHTPEALSALVATGVLNRDRLKDRLGQLGFRAEYGGFFAITEDKSPRLSSGHGASGRSPLWPWGAPAAGCAGGGAGLFCTQLAANPTAQDLGAFNARAYRATQAAAGSLGEGLELVYPASDGNGQTPCDGKAHETEYHTTSAWGVLLATTPVWTCAGYKRENLKDRLKYDRSIQPKTASALNSWFLPNGNTISGNALNLWGYAAPRCREHRTEVCSAGARGGKGTCTPKISHECFWDDLASTNLAREDSLAQVWGGLATESNYPTQGLVYAALQSTTADTSDVLFEVGADNKFMSDGIYTAIEEGSTKFYYYRIPLDVGAVLDGQEIMCELDRLRDAGVVPGGTLDMTTVDLASEAIKRLVDGINEAGAKMFFANVPKIAADALNSAGPTGAFPALSGEMGEAVSNLRQAFLSTQHALPVMSNALRAMAIELQTLNVQLQINQAQSSLIDWDTISTGMKELTECSTAAANGGVNFLSAGQVSIMTCVNSAVQIAISLKKRALQKDIIAGEDQKARLAFVERMSQNATDLEQASLGLSEARESINASLSRVDGIKKRAKLAVARALYLNSYQSESQAAYEKSVGSLAALAQTRFDQSLRNAKLMSFYAKRAIEQRLGLSLSDQREDLPLVQAPALWEGDACSYSGFQDTEDPNVAPPAADGTVTAPADGWVAKYGNGFIGDYVNKLENFVESYRLEQNFHEGKDTAIISLRDDVANVRTECSHSARNLFVSAGDLRAPAWAPRNCDPVVSAGVPVLGINCISAVPRQTTTPPLVPDLAVPGLAGYQDSALGYNLQFGDGKSTCVPANSGGCGWKAGSALSQIVHLQAGQHRVSWYTLDDPLAAASVINGAKATILILRGTGTLAAPALVNSADSPAMAQSPFVFGRPGSGARWKRASEEFKVAIEGDYEVGFGVPTGAQPPSTQQVTIGAPMLEAINGDRSYLLGNFEATDEFGSATIAACEDTDGSVFRLQKWARNCMRLCTDGFSANCKNGPEHCYHEFNFGVSQAALQNGKLLNYSGFARGNFNYRIDSLGVNFVGSNVRNCENASLPSTCYNAGFVPYSLQHNGPFFVRNRGGDDYQALLFDGRIEHARGLALERYFTSPISSTDRDLISDYMRSEFSGRPLDGNFTLRVWDDQGVDFSSIQDVQLVLNYRYWTAFD